MIHLPIDALAFLAGYVVITVATPRFLAHPRLLVARPRLTIGLWLSALATSVTLLWFGTGIIISQWVSRIDGSIPVASWQTSVTGSILTWVSLATLGVIAFRLIAASQIVAADRAAQISQVTPLLRSSRIEVIGGHRVRIVESEAIVFAAVPFAGSIVASTAALTRLTPLQCQAALEHEYTHLRHRHSILVSVAQVAVNAAGGVRASKAFTQTIRIAIELVADDAAAKKLGPTVVADALVALYPGEPDVAERVTRLQSRA